jgi:hypothetical protein
MSQSTRFMRRVQTLSVCCVIALGIAVGMSWAQYPGPAPSAAPQEPSPGVQNPVGPQTAEPYPFGVDPSIAVVIGSLLVLAIIVAIVALGRANDPEARRRASS